MNYPRATWSTISFGLRSWAESGGFVDVSSEITRAEQHESIIDRCWFLYTGNYVYSHMNSQIT